MQKVKDGKALESTQDFLKKLESDYGDNVELAKMSGVDVSEIRTVSQIASDVVNLKRMKTVGSWVRGAIGNITSAMGAELDLSNVILTDETRKEIEAAVETEIQKIKDLVAESRQKLVDRAAELQQKLEYNALYKEAEELGLDLKKFNTFEKIKNGYDDLPETDKKGLSPLEYLTYVLPSEKMNLQNAIDEARNKQKK